MKSALMTLLRGCWGMIKVDGAFLFPVFMCGMLLGAYDLGFGAVWREYLYLTVWWGCCAAFVMIWLSYKETKHPILYKAWAIVLFYTFFYVLLLASAYIS